MKYFCVSDLHGVSSAELLKALYDKGFKNFNAEHVVVVAGDITDGLFEDQSLINILDTFQLNRQLIAVRGNHDDWSIKDEPMNPVKISEDNRRFLKSLHYQLETKHFYLAHGMYLAGKLKDDDDFGYESTWASPALYYQEPHNWWYMEQWIVKLIHEKYPTLDAYEESFDKPVLLGHFGAQMVIDRIEAMIDLGLATNEKLKIDKDGFISYGKIHFLDSEILHSKRVNGMKKGEVSVKVLEF